ncbi:MAG TPA: hypothetical protein VD813_11865, partial [Pseudonocardia sp.]|nr:hypothetical protein [Pseudonocardia sp.]
MASGTDPFADRRPGPLADAGRFADLPVGIGAEPVDAALPDAAPGSAVTATAPGSGAEAKNAEGSTLGFLGFGRDPVEAQLSASNNDNS